MALIEEWRWEKSDENPLQPFWDFMIDYVKADGKGKKRKN